MPDYGKTHETKLSPKEENNFQKWLNTQREKGTVQRGDYDYYKKQGHGYDYDFRAAFKAGESANPETGHWSDIGKKPNHPTFSDQSKYASVPGASPGRWEGDEYVPPPDQSGTIRSGFLKGVKPKRY